jgi:hypothetical protein
MLLLDQLKRERAARLFRGYFEEVGARGGKLAGSRHDSSELFLEKK